jgi:hypothetical protein
MHTQLYFRDLMIHFIFMIEWLRPGFLESGVRQGEINHDAASLWRWTDDDLPAEVCG